VGEVAEGAGQDEEVAQDDRLDEEVGKRAQIGQAVGEAAQVIQAVREQGVENYNNEEGAPERLGAQEDQYDDPRGDDD
jgi:hypothetical protein